MSVAFEDLNTYNGNSTGWSSCNESVAFWQEALDRAKVPSVERAAAICSGGEVSLFSFLPRVEKELELIDHAYSSMFFAIGKHHLIETCGANVALELLTSKEKSELASLFMEGNKGLPTANHGSGYTTGGGYLGSNGTHNTEISAERLETFLQNKDKVRYLHGDVSDLVPRGPYDLVYLSNALDYAGRTRTSNHPVKEIVKPGGYICITLQSFYDDANWLPEPIRGLDILFWEQHRGMMTWNYVICRTKEA